MPSYTNKMATASWPRILWRHFTLWIWYVRRLRRRVASRSKSTAEWWSPTGARAETRTLRSPARCVPWSPPFPSRLPTPSDSGATTAPSTHALCVQPSPSVAPPGVTHQLHITHRCPGRHISTWPTTAVSCPTALGALCGQLTFWLALCCEHSVVMVIEL